MGGALAMIDPQLGLRQGLGVSHAKALVSYPVRVRVSICTQHSSAATLSGNMLIIQRR